MRCTIFFQFVHSIVLCVLWQLLLSLYHTRSLVLIRSVFGSVICAFKRKHTQTYTHTHIPALRTTLKNTKFFSAVLFIQFFFVFSFEMFLFSNAYSMLLMDDTNALKKSTFSVYFHFCYQRVFSFGVFLFFYFCSLSIFFRRVHLPYRKSSHEFK